MPTLSPEDVSLVAHAVARVQELPGVATTDWARRAAEAISTLWPGSAVSVAIGALGSDSHRSKIELGDVVAPGLASSRGLDSGALRARVAHLLESLGQPTPLAGACGMRWANGKIGTPWSRLGMGELIMGVGRLDERDLRQGGRLVVVEMGNQGVGLERERMDARATMLGAVMGVLVVRARLGFVPGPVDASRRVTASEQVILEMLVLGKTVREIALELDRSPHTVHDHVKNLHRKLRAKTRGELIARALGHHGGVESESPAPVAVAS